MLPLWRTGAKYLSALARLRPHDNSTAAGRSSERYRRIALTIASGMAARALGTAVSLLTVSVLLSYLGKERFGLWSAIMSTVVWLSLSDLGLASGLVNVVAEAHGRDDREAAARAVSTTFCVLALVAVVLAGVFAVVIPFVSWDGFFGARGIVPAEMARLSVTAAVATFLLGLPLSITPAVYAGYQKSYVANLFMGIGSCVTLAAVGAVIWLRADLPTLIFVLSLAGVLTNLVNLLVLTRRQMRWLSLRAARVTQHAWRRLARTARPLLFFQIGALMVNQSQLFTLAHTTDLGTVADYSLIVRIMQVFSSVVLLSTGAFFPSYREAMERGDADWVRTGFRHMVRLRMGLAAGFALVLLAFGNPLLRLWLQRSDVSFGPVVWAALGAHLLAGAWVSAHSDLLIILDRIWAQVGLVMVNGTATVLLTLWLSPAHGVLGVIVAGAFVTVIGWTWLFPLLARPILTAPASEVVMRPR